MGGSAAPWVGGFVGSADNWTAWVSGGIGTVLGVAGYLRGDSGDSRTVVRHEADATYRDQ